MLLKMKVYNLFYIPAPQCLKIEISVLVKKQYHQKFLHKISIDFKDNLQTKLPRAFYINKCVIRIIFDKSDIRQMLLTLFK